MHGQILAVLFFVAEFRLAPANSDYSNGQACIPANQFEIKVDIDGNEIDINWKFNQSRTLYGFQTRVYKSDNSVIYKSPVLHQSERSMKLQQELNGQNKICVAAYENSTNILSEKCEDIEITDLKIIIGILAGVIFLIPCIIGISYVIYKDFKVKRLEYEKLDSKLDVEKPAENKEKVIIDKMKQAVEHTKTSQSGNTKDNKAFVPDEDLKHHKDFDQTAHESNIETVTANIHKSAVSDERSEKSDDKNRKVPEKESQTESDSQTVAGSSETENFQKLNRSDEVAVTVTEEEVTGTNL